MLTCLMHRTSMCFVAICASSRDPTGASKWTRLHACILPHLYLAPLKPASPVHLPLTHPLLLPSSSSSSLSFRSFLLPPPSLPPPPLPPSPSLLPLSLPLPPSSPSPSLSLPLPPSPSLSLPPPSPSLLPLSLPLPPSSPSPSLSLPLPPSPSLSLPLPPSPSLSLLPPSLLSLSVR